MSYLQFQQQCNKCKRIWNAAFGMVGTEQIAGPPERCPHCGAPEIEKIADGWSTDDSNKVTYYEKPLHVAVPKKINRYNASEISDDINHPPHYTQGIECADYLESHNMDFFQGNAIKYLTRFKHKGTPVKDLDKAIWYCNRLKEIELKKKDINGVCGPR